MEHLISFNYEVRIIEKYLVLLQDFSYTIFYFGGEAVKSHTGDTLRIHKNVSDQKISVERFL